MMLPFDLEEDPVQARERLVSSVKDVPLPYRKWIATYYPDAYVRREYLKSIGVVFKDDTSFVNLGFFPVPNSPGDTHVFIGSNVSIAPNVTCVTSSNANNGDEINAFAYVSERLTCEGDVVIGDEAWIGANATILPGVTVGRCAVVGAGAVLVRDADAYGLYAGVPAKKIGDVRKWEDGFEFQQ